MSMPPKSPPCSKSQNLGSMYPSAASATCRDVLEAAGPAFIKWGQWAATRHDLFPPDFCAILEHLHTQVPARLRPALGLAKPPPNLFSLD